MLLFCIKEAKENTHDTDPKSIKAPWPLYLHQRLMAGIMTSSLSAPSKHFPSFK